MDRLDGIRRRHEASLAATVGSFAQHVIYRSTKDHVCPICGGAKKSGYACCISCSTHQHSPHKALLADTVRIFAYAPMECSGDASHQMTRYMYRYKENRCVTVMLCPGSRVACNRSGRPSGTVAPQMRKVNPLTG